MPLNYRVALPVLGAICILGLLIALKIYRREDSLSHHQLPVETTEVFTTREEEFLYAYSPYGPGKDHGLSQNVMIFHVKLGAGLKERVIEKLSRSWGM